VGLAPGNTAEYVAKIEFRLTKVLDGCRFTKTADIQSSAIVEYLGTLRDIGKSVRAANDYLAAVKESLSVGPDALVSDAFKRAEKLNGRAI
jgi:hypothetical protein